MNRRKSPQREVTSSTINRHYLSPVRQCLGHIYSRLSDILIRADQKIDGLYRKNIITASIVAPIFTVAVILIIRLSEVSDYEQTCNSFSSLLFSSLLLVLGAVCVHIMINVSLLFIKGYYYSALRWRAAATQIFPVLGSGLLSLNLVMLSFRFTTRRVIMKISLPSGSSLRPLFK